MNRYDKYKPTDIEWIGEIPEHWQLKKLKHITYLKARVGWHGLKAEEFSLDESLPYCITGTDFNNGIINWETCYHINEERYNEDKYIQLKENDLLVTKDGTIGKVAVVKNLKGKAILNSGVFVMRPTAQQYNSEFMYWLIQSEAFSEFIRYTSKGSTIIHLYQDTFLNWRIGLPSYNEQTAIANYLDEKAIQIDKLIANKQQLIELLKEERTAIINKAVSGEGKNWERKKLKYLVKDKLKYGANEPSEFENDKDPRYIRITDFGDDGKLRNDTFKSLPFKTAKDFFLKDGDILFARSGATVGKTFQFKDYNGIACFAGYLIRARIDEKQMMTDFLYYYTKSGIYENWKSSIFIQATIQNIGADKYSLLEIPVPTLSKQAEIIKNIDKAHQRINSTINKIENEIELIKEYKISLISEVVTGKLKITDITLDISIPSIQAVLAAEIMSQLYEEKSFGRVKFQKVLYLCEYVCHLEGLESNYHKAAAGPLDEALLTKIEKELRQLQWIDTVSSPSKKYNERISYASLNKLNDYQNWYDKYWGDENENIQHLIGLLRFANTEKCEMIATLFAAWNDLIIKGFTVPDDNLIIKKVFEWHKKKKRLTKEQWQKELSFMRKQKLIPKGFGKLTLHNE